VKGAIPRPTTPTPVVKLDPNRVAEIFEDRKEFIELFSKPVVGVAKVSAETNDRYSGALSIRVGRADRDMNIVAGSPTWKFKIVEKPSATGEFRYLRFAWKKIGGNTIAFQIPSDAATLKFTYYAGAVPPAPIGNSGKPLYKVGEIPRNWTLVTRDLFQDNKGP